MTEITYGTSAIPGALVKRRSRDPGITKPSHVRVVATKEDYRRALRHGVTKQRFLSDINQSVEWPNDTFTHRRLREGSVVLAEEKPQAEAGEQKAKPATEQTSQPKRPEAPKE
jgi:hypothetical protein